MTVLEVGIDAARPLLRLDKGSKRLVFNVIAAINNTAKMVQAAERAQLSRAFTVRKPEFLLKQVKFFGAGFDLKTGVNRWEARVGIGIGKPPGGTPLLLPRFELGASRVGVKGGAVAVPVVGGARPSQPQSIPDALFVQRLQLRRPAGRRRKRRPSDRSQRPPVRRGLLGTYQVPGVGIFQQVAGRVAARILYVFKPRVRLPAKLQFVATARRVIQANYARELQRLVNESFARFG